MTTIHENQEITNFAADRKASTAELRRKMWRSITILRKFTVPVLMQTVPGSSERAARQYVRELLLGGLIKKQGGFVRGRVGEYQGYELSE